MFVDAILRRSIIPIHGDDLQTRSFTFVDGTVRGIPMAAESPGFAGEIHVGSNREVIICGLAEPTHRLCGTGKPLRFEFVLCRLIRGRPYEDVRRRVLAIAKAKRVLGF